jgi:hypothetical protein
MNKISLLKPLKPVNREELTKHNKALAETFNLNYEQAARLKSVQIKQLEREHGVVYDSVTGKYYPISMVSPA